MHNVRTVAIKNQRAHIIKKAAKGNALAQKALFEQCYGYVMSITLRYMSSREEAEEMLNDIFFKVFKLLGQYDSNYPLKSWVRRIAINTCIDKLRVDKNRLTTVPLEEWENYGEENLDFELNDSIQLLPLLQDLPAQYRTVFNLYVFEDYKHREIAEKLGISVGTSKSNFARAKQIIKQKVANNKETFKKLLASHSARK